ncbi:MAG: DUF3341 domain-containing protein [Calditrichaeota bacterium]|nr:MAG: DUF3341 domain-containing protein [Calditrichota bacterium]
MAEFEQPGQLLKAAEKAAQEGYHKMDAYSPIPIEGLSEALGKRHTRLPLLVLIGGLLGAFTGFFMQYFISVIDYPVNIGGRPLNSWPSFIPVTFELTVLFAAFAAFFGVMVLNKLPQPYHPVFNVEQFERASQDRFFLCIEAQDSKFDMTQTRKFLESLKPVGVYEVEP